jgi:SAM-dependent methyltransferase
MILDKFKFSLLPQYIRIQARHDYNAFQNLRQRIKPFICDIKNLNVLDVGCGKRAPFTLLFHSLGTRAIGIDVDILARGIDLTKYRRILATRGSTELLRKLVADVYYDKIYYQELQRAADFPLNFDEIDLREMNASQTTFEEEFDLVVSNAVFEHLKNVGEALQEMKRIMKQNALLHIEIHLFPSLTGGHNVLWSDPETQQVVLGNMSPWDHLRKQKCPIDPSLNRLREGDYYRLFSEHFAILEWVTEYEESEHYLTPELRSELSEYSSEELLKRSIVVIARKIS